MIALVITTVLLLVRDQESIYVRSAYRVEDPRFPSYIGAIVGGPVTRGGRFEVVARSAVQRSSDLPIVDIRGMLARLWLDQGPVTLVANAARYNIDRQLVQVLGPIRVAGPDGYRLATSDVRVDLKAREVTGSGGVKGEMTLGQFTAGRLRADLAERKVILDQGARLKITQGAVR